MADKHTPIAGRARKLAACCPRVLNAVEANAPTFFDLVEDTARFRGLTLALFALMITFLFRTGLDVVFLSQPLSLTASLQCTLSSADPPETADIGKTVLPAVTARLLDPRGLPLVGVLATLSVTLSDQQAWSLTDSYGFTDSAPYDGSGLPMGGRFALPGFPPRALATPSLTGAQAVSDTDGYVRFRGLKMVTGLPAPYRVTVSAAGSSAVVGKIRFGSRAVKVEVGLGTGGGNATTRGRRVPTVLLGAPIPDIHVRVMGEGGAPLSGKTVTVIPAPFEESEFAGVGSSNEIFHPRAVLLGNVHSGPTGLDGSVILRNVTLLGSSLRRIRLWVVVDGVVGMTTSGQAALEFSLRQRRVLHPSVRVPEAPRVRALGDVLLDEFSVQLVQQPSGEVVEGEVLTVQPAVRVLRYVLAGGGGGVYAIPATGAVVFAFPFEQAGFRSDSLMSPAAAAELRVVGGSRQAVLGNLGRVKRLFNATSAPVDGDGVARFTGLGFIRHGPAGVYTLSFACGGVHLQTETGRINVTTSVASVRYYTRSMLLALLAADVVKVTSERVLSGAATGTPSARILQGYEDSLPSSIAPPLSSVLCNYPTCQSRWGSSSGYTYYNGLQTPEKNRVQNELLVPGQPLDPSLILSAPAGPSGILSYPLSLLVQDARGRPLAGKSAVPFTTPRFKREDLDFAAAEDETYSNASVSVVELPFTGASVTALEMPGFSAAGFPPLSDADTHPSSPGFAAIEGALAFVRHNLDAFEENSDPREEYGASVAPWSYLRVVAAPAGHSRVNLWFDVDGVRVGAQDSLDTGVALDVYNWDVLSASDTNRPTYQPDAEQLCAYLRIDRTPTSLLQDGATQPIVSDLDARPTPFRGPDGAPFPFTVQAVNSFGQPVQTPAVGMYVVDALGYVMYTTVGGEHLAPDTSYTAFLRNLGGAAGLTIGNLTASFTGNWMHGPGLQVDSDAAGTAQFANVSLRRVQNTWVRFAFAALYPNISFLQFTDVGQPVTPDAISSVLDSPATCISQYSAPVTIDSVVGAAEWVWPDGRRTEGEDFDLEVQDAWGDTPDAAVPLLPELHVYPSARQGGANLPLSDVPPAKLAALLDEAMDTYPSHVGLQTFVFGPIPSEGARKYLNGLEVPSPAIDADALLPSTSYDNVQAACLPGFDAVFATQASILGKNESGSLDFGGYSYAAMRQQSALVNGSSSAPVIGTFPRLFPKRGTPGTYAVTAFVGGVVSEPAISVKYADSIDIVLVKDWSLKQQDCFDNVTVTSVETGEFVREDSPVPFPCPNACSGHGDCVCGVCVCFAGWDGAHDCSRRYLNDGLSVVFAVDPFYGSKYAGLPVFDVRRALQLGRRNRGSDVSAGDLFPRMMLPESVLTGKIVSFTALYSALFNLSTLMQASGVRVTGSIPLAVRVGDALNDIVAANSGGYPPPLSLQSFSNAMNSTGLIMQTPSAGEYRTVPVLMTCDGVEVREWAWVEGETGCSTDVVTVVSDNTDLPPGVSTFKAYGVGFLASSADIFTQPSLDHRLMLAGVPSGCYRFKHVYAPQGSGSRRKRRIDNPVSTAQAASLGLSRPFRVLSPVENVEVVAADGDTTRTEGDSLTLARETPLPYNVKVVLKIRDLTWPDMDLSLINASDANGEPFTDTCADRSSFKGNFDSVTGIKRRAGVVRCPPLPAGGLEVTVTAVSVQSAAEYSLFVPGRTNDCARTSATRTSSGWDYVVAFSDLRFPRSPAVIPSGYGSATALASAVPAGMYRLRFTAYGTSAESPFTVTIADGPSHVVMADYDLRLQFPEGLDVQAGVASVLGRRALPGLDWNFLHAVPGGAASSSGNLTMVRAFVGLAVRGLSEVTKLVNATALQGAGPPLTGAAAALSTLALSPTALRGILGYDAGPLWSAAPGVTVTLDVAYGPPGSNVAMNATLAFAETRDGQTETSFSMPIYGGVTGWYILRVSTPGVKDPAVLAVNVTNPVSRVDVWLDGTPVRPAWWRTGRQPPLYAPWERAFRAVETETQPRSLRVCGVDLPRVVKQRPGCDSSVCPSPSPAATEQEEFYTPPQRVAVRFVVPLEAPLPVTEFGGNSSGSPTSEAAWLRGMRLVADHALVRGGGDVRSTIDLGLRLTVSAVGRKPVTGSLSALDAELYTGEDGCITLSAMTLSDVPASTRARLTLSVKGVEGPPVDVEVVTLQDARPVSLDKLRERVVVPIFAAMPIFGANSVRMPIPLRLLCLCAGTVSIAAMAGTDGVRFVTEFQQLRGLFLESDLAYIMVLQVAWLACLLLVLVYTLLAACSLHKPARVWCASSCSHRAGKRSASGGRGRQASFEVQGASSAQMAVMLQGVEGGFYATRRELAWAYVRARLPKLGRVSSSHARAPPPVRGGADGGKQTLTSLLLRAWRCIPCEDPALVFFYPQRLLVSLVVSALCSGLVVMLVVYFTGHLSDYAEHALSAFLAGERKAVSAAVETSLRANDALINSVTAALDWSATASALTDAAAEAGGVTSPSSPQGASVYVQNAVDAALETANAGAQSYDLSSARGLLPPDLAAAFGNAGREGLLTSGLSTRSAPDVQALPPNLAIQSAVSELQASQTQFIRPWLDAFVSDLRRSAGGGIVLALVFVTCCWAHFLYSYKQHVLALRRGDKDALGVLKGHLERVPPSAAVDLVGIQAAGTAVTLGIATAILTAVWLVLSAPQFLRVVQNYAAGVLAATLGITVLLTFLRAVVLSRVAVSSGRIVLRRCFSLLDLWFTVFQIITGVLVALSRLFVSLVTFLALVMRPDIPVSAAFPRADPACTAFCAVLSLDTTYHNPTFMVVGGLLTGALHAIRDREARGRTSVPPPADAACAGGVAVRVGCPPIGADASRATRVVRSLSTPRTGPTQEAGAGAEGGGQGTVCNPLSAHAGTRGGSKATEHGEGEAKRARWASERARTRWWLAAVLATNPDLQLYRKKRLAEGLAEGRCPAPQPPLGSEVHNTN